jgi:hypothetical protein
VRPRKRHTELEVAVHFRLHDQELRGILSLFLKQDGSKEMRSRRNHFHALSKSIHPFVHPLRFSELDSSATLCR